MKCFEKTNPKPPRIQFDFYLENPPFPRLLETKKRDMMELVRPFKRGSIMKKWLETFKRLMSENKPQFVLLCLRLGVAFLFFIAMMIPFFKLIQFGDVVNQTSSVQFPAGWVFLILTLGLLGGVLYLTLAENAKMLKIGLLVQSIQASVQFLWGLIIYGVLVAEAATYPDASVAFGFGFILQLILIALLWFTALGESLILPLLKKWFPSKLVAQPEATPEQPTA